MMPKNLLYVNKDFQSESLFKTLQNFTELIDIRFKLDRLSRSLDAVRRIFQSVARNDHRNACVCRDLSLLAELFETLDRSKAGFTAPARGLALVKVDY